MIIVPRIPITGDMIVSTNAVDPADYDAAKVYAQGERVAFPPSILEYESVTDDNLGNAPDANDGTHWRVVGNVNSRRMIDGTATGQTERAGSIVLKINTDTLFSSVVLVNVSAAAASISIEDDGVEIYSETINLVATNDVENVWDYSFTDPQYNTVAIFHSVPGHVGVVATLTVSAPDGTAKVGEALFGLSRVIGETVVGTRARIKDYSVKEVNSFGEAEIVERASVRGATYEVAVDPQDNDRIMRILEENRAKICAFYPAKNMERYGLTVVGFFNDYEPELTHRGRTIVSIPVEGIS